jgi:hypothetical protein
MVQVVHINTVGPNPTLCVSFVPASLDDEKVISVQEAISEHFGKDIPVCADGFSTDGDRQVVFDISDWSLIDHLNEMTGFIADTLGAKLCESHELLEKMRTPLSQPAN